MSRQLSVSANNLAYCACENYEQRFLGCLLRLRYFYIYTRIYLFNFATKYDWLSLFDMKDVTI